MPSKPLCFARTAMTILTLIAGVLFGNAWAGTAKVIYSFAGGTDGEYADTELVVDSAGNLYGATVQGGKFNSGTVFELSRSGDTWTHTVLYNFMGGTDGGEPYKGVTLDAQGNLYGTAVTGGGGSCEGGCGVTYKLTRSGGTWTQSVVHAFTGGDDGSGPGSPVVFDRAGNLYGMTPTGGANGLGTIYQLSRVDGSLRVIHTFTGGADGSGGSAGRMAFDPAGNLYGVATTGGGNQAGVAFKLIPTQSGEWKAQPLYAFKDEPDAGFPYGGLVADKKGNLYGTTYYAGAHDVGTVYRLSQRNGKWVETGLYSFKGGTDGSGPISTLAFDQAGNLYGTASEGGAGCNCGTIFKITLVGNPGYSVAYRFQNAPDGAFPYDGMVMDSTGTLYGATTHGGTSGEGAIYSFTP
jgi:uncharacterized repeat protein (TIGR03803 family)